MKHSIYFLIAAFSLALVSCKKEVDPAKLGYEEGAINELVIESYINNKNDSIITLISNPKGYFSNEGYPKISGANVLAKKSNGQELLCTEVKPGYYSAYLPVEAYQLEYKIEITYEGKTYSASSKMPSPVTIDSVKIEEPIFSFSGMDNFYNIKIYIDDPADETNYYRMTYRQNSEQLEGVFTGVMYDDLTNGKVMTFEVFDEILPTDTVKITMEGIDRPTYEYYRKLQDLYSGNPSFSMPENPTGNFGKEILGNFSAYTVDSIEFVAKELADSIGFEMQVIE